MIKNFYDQHICPHMIDFFMNMNIIKKQRLKVIPNAKGKVLEVGIGSGLNLEFYDQNKVSKIYALDPHPKLEKMTRKRADKQGIEIEFFPVMAEKIPLEDHFFDTIVCTYTLCSIEDPIKALKEMKRVLKPAGQYIFSEHGLAPEENVIRWQNRLNPIQNLIGGGCNLNRDIPKLIEDGGYKIGELNKGYIPGPKFISYHYWGHSVPV